MKWNSYGIIIFILSLVLTTTIEARGRGGGGRSSGSRSSGGSRSSSSSSSGSHSSSSSSGSHGSSSGSHGSSSGSHGSSSGSHGSSSGSHGSSSGSHGSSSGSYGSSSGSHGSNIGSHGSSSGSYGSSSGSYGSSSGSHSSDSSIGGYGSHGISTSGLNSYGNHGNSQGYLNSIYGISDSSSIPSSSHSSPSHYTPYTNYNWDPSYQHKASRPSVDSDLNEFMQGLATGNVLSHGLPSYRTPAYYYRNNWGSHTSSSDDKYESPYYSSSNSNPPEPTGTNELVDLTNELNKSPEDIESMYSLLEKIAKGDYTQGQGTNGLVETRWDLARSYATPELTTTAMPTTSPAITTELPDSLNELNKPTIAIESHKSLFKKIAKFGKALHKNSGEVTTVASAKSLNNPTITIESHNFLYKRFAKFGKALTTNILEETTEAAVNSDATTELPFEIASTSMEPDILNAELKSFINTEMSKPTLEEGTICKPDFYEEKNEFGINIIIEKNNCNPDS